VLKWFRLLTGMSGRKTILDRSDMCMNYVLEKERNIGNEN